MSLLACTFCIYKAPFRCVVRKLMKLQRKRKCYNNNNTKFSESATGHSGKSFTHWIVQVQNLNFFRGITKIPEKQI